mmetsp:Transcript_21807/g.43268  ORF Transcript_21807/g.43268 Transcript_21807/m.43268 type:complete len:231 (-) Transcript_21807:300-992(-)
MHKLLVLAVVFLLDTAAAFKKSINAESYCSVCQVSLEEIEKSILATQRKGDLQVGFRVGEKKKVKFARSEARVTEILEDEIKKKLEKYILSGHEEPGGGKKIMKMMDDMGGLGVMGGGKDVTNMYQHIVDEYEDELIRLFTASTPIMTIKQRVCVELAKACTRVSEADPNEEEEREKVAREQQKAKDEQKAAEKREKRAEAKRKRQAARGEPEDWAADLAAQMMKGARDL